MAHAKPQPRRVISVGTLPELLTSREAVLRSQGYDVFTTVRAMEAVGEIKAGNCAVLLICHSVNPEAWDDLIRQYRASCPNGRIVGISNAPVTQLPKDVDALVYGIDGPEAVLKAIEGESV